VSIATQAWAMASARGSAVPWARREQRFGMTKERDKPNEPAETSATDEAHNQTPEARPAAPEWFQSRAAYGALIAVVAALTGCWRHAARHAAEARVKRAGEQRPDPPAHPEPCLAHHV